MLGQVLDAVVIGREGKNSIRLNVAGAEVRAATALPLRRGENLTVRVTQLRPIVTLTPMKPVVAPERTLLQNTVNRTLPLQRPIGKVLDQLRMSLQPPAPTNAGEKPAAALPAVVHRGAERLLSSVATLSAVTDPKRLPAIIRQSGVFAESTLAKSIVTPSAPAAVPQGDLKLQLLQLRAGADASDATKPVHKQSASTTAPATSTASPVRVQESPTAIVAQRAGSANASTGTTPLPDDADNASDPLRQFSRLVDAAVAKIETNQLKTLGALLDGDAQFHLDVPVRFEDGHRDIRLQIFQDEDPNSDPGRESNSIVLEIPLGEDASVRAVVTMNADDLAVRLWSDNTWVRQALSNGRERLLDRLRANGLDHVSVALSALKPFDQWGRTFNGLVDTTA